MRRRTNGTRSPCVRLRAFLNQRTIPAPSGPNRHSAVFSSTARSLPGLTSLCWPTMTDAGRTRTIAHRAGRFRSSRIGERYWLPAFSESYWQDRIAQLQERYRSTGPTNAGKSAQFALALIQELAQAVEVEGRVAEETPALEETIDASSEVGGSASAYDSTSADKHGLVGFGDALERAYREAMIDEDDDNEHAPTRLLTI